MRAADIAEDDHVRVRTVIKREGRRIRILTFFNLIPIW